MNASAPFPWPDVLIIAGLIVLNGLFSMSELAIVSARPARLRVAADKGRRGARIALAMQADPGKLLSTSQIGITLIAIISGAFSGASLGKPMGSLLAMVGVPAVYADEAGFTLVIAITTYFSVVVGELVPKQLALRAADTIAILAAAPMALIARVVAPFVWLLDKSSAVLLRLTGMRNSGDERLTAEELQMVFVEAERSGVIEEDERAMMAGIMRLADRPVRELMTPRIELDWIDLATAGAELNAKVIGAAHALLPVGDGGPDSIVGVLPVRGALSELLGGHEPSIAALMRRAEVIPDQLDAMDALRIMQQSEVAMALVHDEYGHFEGVVTPADLLTAIVGGFASHQDAGDDPLITEREDGSLLVSGALAADALAQRLVIELAVDREYATAAGYVLSVLKRLPKEGEHFADQGWRFEIVDMDGLKIDKLLVSREAGPAGAQPD